MKEEFGMGRTFGMQERCLQNGRLDVNVVIILKWIIKTGYEGVDSIRVPQDVYRWCALLNAVMKLWVPYKGDKF
jgi:hypothetical protein